MSDKVLSAVASDGVTLDYEASGTCGPVVALLHGGMAGRWHFSRQRALADRFRLLLVSSRGNDGADATLPADYGIDTSEVDDLAAILDAEGADRVHLIGHSSGGAVAFAFARRFPGRVARTVLLEPTLIDLLPEAERGNVHRALARVVEAGAADGDQAALAMALTVMGGEGWSKLDADAQAARLRALAPLSPVVVPHVRALMNFPVTPADVAAFAAPVLLVYGRRTFAFHQALSRRLHALRPDWQQIQVEDAAHNVHRDRPDLVNPAIGEFLGTEASM